MEADQGEGRGEVAREAPDTALEGETTLPGVRGAAQLSRELHENLGRRSKGGGDRGEPGVALGLAARGGAGGGVG